MNVTKISKLEPKLTLTETFLRHSRNLDKTKCKKDVSKQDKTLLHSTALVQAS